jgi:hypothetical protein
MKIIVENTNNGATVVACNIVRYLNNIGIKTIYVNVEKQFDNVEVESRGLKN